MDQRAFGSRIRQARKEQKITSEKLSTMCGVNAVFIRQIESGARLPSMTVFVRICNALHTSPEFFLAEEIKVSSDIEEKDEIIRMLSGITGKQRDMAKNVLSALIYSMKNE